jgi:hypothetical protein
MSLREKLKSVHPGFGETPPAWTNSSLGLADRDPAKVMSELGVGSYIGSGSDWRVDIYNLMTRAVSSRILRNLFRPPQNNDRLNAISIQATSILYGEKGLKDAAKKKLMVDFIKQILWAAEQRGKIAMPTKLKVEVGQDGTSVWIMWKI